MKDGIVIENGKNGRIIVNQKSFCELVKWIIVEYIGISYDAASMAVEDRSSYFETITTVEDATFVGHDWPYFYTAMDMYFGEHSHSIDKFIVKERPDAPNGLERYKKIESDILYRLGLNEPIVWE